MVGSCRGASGCSAMNRAQSPWVSDPRAPGFREEAHRQAQLLRGAPEEPRRWSSL
ncbi:MAG: antitoxin MazE-like protein [Acetobacteraceae bacterium]